MDNRERPDGSIATGIGWVLVVLGLVAMFLGTQADTFEGILASFAFGNLGIGLGVLLLSLGYLVRAIWFLPGREILDAEVPAQPEQSTKCRWCGRDMFPYRACSSVGDEVNKERAPRVRDETCIAEFRARGLIAGPVDGE